jgi:hypothetical protein
MMIVAEVGANTLIYMSETILSETDTESGCPAAANVMLIN